MGSTSLRGLSRARSLLLRLRRPSAPPASEAPPEPLDEPVDPAAQDALAPPATEPDLACRAPFTSLHVDQFGDARPCCQSSRVLGNISDQTLEEIWRSEGLAELRAAIERNDLSLGCEHCEWAGRRGRATTYAVRFDHDRLPAPDAGPTRLELAPSNACNLQCTMCNGDWSSSIRLHREGRPALERRFGEVQLAEVEALVEGVDEIHLFGGEPLLMPEGLRILEIAAASDTRCVITTNGTTFTPRVAKLIDRPGVDLVVSVDGTSAEVYESIRCGASWRDLEAHLDSFIEIAERHGNSVALAHCLMTVNWHEFAAHLRWAQHRSLAVYVNDVLSPVEMSLHHLTPPELAAVISSLRACEADLDDLGPIWRDTWDLALGRLEQTLADSAGGERHEHLGQISVSTPVDEGADELSPFARRLHERRNRTDATVVAHLAPDLTVRSVVADGVGTDLLRCDPTDLVGKPSADIRTLLAETDRPDARLVVRWDRTVAIEERRYDLGTGPRSERRSVESSAEGVTLRFDYWRGLTEEEEIEVLRSSSQDGRLVELEVDDKGILVAIGPADLAASFGLRTDIGVPCQQPTDLVVASRADPGPSFVASELEPGLVAVDLVWPDGHHLLALARAGPQRTIVRVGRAAVGPPAP